MARKVHDLEENESGRRRWESARGQEGWLKLCIIISPWGIGS